MNLIIIIALLTFILSIWDTLNNLSEISSDSFGGCLFLSCAKFKLDLDSQLTWQHKLSSARARPETMRAPTAVQGDSGRATSAPTWSATHSPTSPRSRPEWKPSMNSPTYCTSRVISPKRIPVDWESYTTYSL